MILGATARPFAALAFLSTRSVPAADFGFGF
jgi:hypothetical protein